jgi:hypothetical protein
MKLEGDMKSKSKITILSLLTLLSFAVLFQNCSAAAPPDISNLNQSSTAPPPPPTAGVPNPTQAPVATPAPVSTPVPVVTLSLPSEFFPTGFCSYSCVGVVTYVAFANDASFCHANPIGVAGTETMFTADYTQQLARPFSRCIVTQNLTASPDGYTGKSTCN